MNHGPISSLGATGAEEDQTKAAFGFIGGIIAGVAAWLGFKKQKAATVQAEIEADVKKKQIEAEEKRHEREEDSKKQDFEERRESRLQDRQERLEESLDKAHETIDRLTDKTLRQGKEILELRSEVNYLKEKLKNKKGISIPSIELQSHPELIHDDEASGTYKGFADE